MKEFSSYTCPAEGDIDCPYYKNGYCYIDGNPPKSATITLGTTTCGSKRKRKLSRKKKRDDSRSLNTKEKLEKCSGGAFKPRSFGISTNLDYLSLKILEKLIDKLNKT